MRGGKVYFVSAWRRRSCPHASRRPCPHGSRSSCPLGGSVARGASAEEVPVSLAGARWDWRRWRLAAARGRIRPRMALIGLIGHLGGFEQAQNAGHEDDPHSDGNQRNVKQIHDRPPGDVAETITGTARPRAGYGELMEDSRSQGRPAGALSHHPPARFGTALEPAVESGAFVATESRPIDTASRSARPTGAIRQDE